MDTRTLIFLWACLLSLLVCALAWTCQPCPAAQVMQRLIIRHGPSLSFRRQQAHYASIYCWQRGGWARAEGNEAADRNAKWKREREERGCMAAPKKWQLRPDIRKDFEVGLEEKWKRMSVVRSQTGGEGGAVEKWLLERPHGLKRRFWKRRSLKSGLMFSWKGWRHARLFQGILHPQLYIVRRTDHYRLHCRNKSCVVVNNELFRKKAVFFSSCSEAECREVETAVYSPFAHVYSSSFGSTRESLCRQMMKPFYFLHIIKVQSSVVWLKPNCTFKILLLFEHVLVLWNCYQLSLKYYDILIKARQCHQFGHICG